MLNEVIFLQSKLQPTVVYIYISLLEFYYRSIIAKKKIKLQNNILDILLVSKKSSTWFVANVGNVTCK